MAKQTITQRSFLLGEAREEFLAADDLELRGASLRTARNVRVKGTRTIEGRMGTEFIKMATASHRVWEILLATGDAVVLEMRSNRLAILNTDGVELWNATSFSNIYSPVEDAWAEGFGNDIIIGVTGGMWKLSYDGSWTLAAFAFDAAPGSELAQPYWSFRGDLTMTPSARTGSITLTSSGAFFTASHIGMRIRYAYREILITAFTNSTTVTGTVQSELPATYEVTVTSGAGFKVGDVIVGQTTDYQGLIVAVAGNDLTVITLAFFAGPDVGEDVSSNATSSEVTAVSTVSPAASPIWDEPLISPTRGYPKSGVSAAGRLFLCNFPEATDVIACSSARTIYDFKVGTEDDDAIARAVGDNRPIFRHVVNQGDVLFFSDRGCYLISLRDGSVISPSNFTPILFDARGCADVRPAKVDDGVVFVEAGGERLALAQLSGNIYLKWSVRTISTFHAHLINNPSFLCGPPLTSDLPEKYLMVANEDGTLAVMSWVDGFDPENIGFTLWETEGDYLAVIPVGGDYWAYVKRVLDGVDCWIYERFSETAIMDCQHDGGDAFVLDFKDQPMQVAGTGWFGGTIIPGAAWIADPSEYPADAVVGFHFDSTVAPWAVTLVQHPKAGLLPARVIRVGVSVLTTDSFQITCNGTTRTFGGYSFGDDLDEPAPARTRIYRTSVMGRRDHPEIEITKHQPGRFQVLSIAQEVSL